MAKEKSTSTVPKDHVLINTICYLRALCRKIVGGPLDGGIPERINIEIMHERRDLRYIESFRSLPCCERNLHSQQQPLLEYIVRRTRLQLRPWTRVILS